MQFVRRIVILSLLLAGVSGAAHAQAVLYGRVTDNAGEPIPSANLYVEETEQGIATQDDGTYRLSSLSAGTHTIVVSAVGFQAVEEQVTLEAGEEREWDVSLEPTVLRGEEVVVTSTMREMYVKDSPVKVQSVSSERLQRGSVTSNIMDVIGNVSGLSTQLNCGVCGTNAIRINGVEGPNTAVLIDGMPIQGALASVYGLNGISPSIIDRVEVIKGPQSTLYGTDALGGVVNIITKDPANTPTLSADVYGRSTQEFNADVAASAKGDRVKGFVSGNVLRMENFFDENGDNFADQVMRSRAALFGKGTVENADGGKILSVAGKGYYEDRTGGLPGFSDDIRGSDEIYGESIYTTRGELLAEFRPPGVEQLRFKGATTYHDQDSFYGGTGYKATQTNSFLQSTWNQQLTDAVRLLGGGTLRYQTYDDDSPVTSGGAKKRFIPGVFAQAKWLPGALTLLGGLRVDYHDESGFVSAPRLAAKYDASDRTTLRASVGTGFRFVNVFTEDHQSLTGTSEVVFADDLDPERSRSVTANLEHILPLGGNPMTLSLDGFYTRFTNKIEPAYEINNNAPNRVIYANNDSEATTRGFTAGLEQNFTAIPLSYDASFTFIDAFIEDDEGTRALDYSPDFLGNLGATYQLRDLGLELDYSANLVGPKRMPDLYVEGYGRDRESPTFSTHDLKLTKSFLDVNSPSSVGVDAYLSVENIFDTTQPTPLVGDPYDAEEGFETIYTWGPIVGRTFSLGVRMNLR